MRHFIYRHVCVGDNSVTIIIQQHSCVVSIGKINYCFQLWVFAINKMSLVIIKEKEKKKGKNTVDKQKKIKKCQNMKKKKMLFYNMV